PTATVFRVLALEASGQEGPGRLVSGDGDLVLHLYPELGAAVADGEHQQFDQLARSVAHQHDGRPEGLRRPW
ncbi:MAG TPA: hypothetical protein VFI97_06710, partial [Arthrobacter sp.]|nr:hypothetical protein [Arthrobacter sp.]